MHYKERNIKTGNDTDETEFDGDNVQLNVDQQSYRKQSITYDSGNVTKNCDQDITKARKILELTENMMKVSSKESEQ